jgi:DNA-binding LacI/PurR family transcriptional regulator
MQLAKEVGYEYEQHTRRETSRPRIVMLIMDNIMKPFYLGIIKDINDYLGEQEVNLTIFNRGYDPIREENYVRSVSKSKYDGIILITTIRTTELVSLLKYGSQFFGRGRSWGNHPSG